MLESVWVTLNQNELEKKVNYSIIALYDQLYGLHAHRFTLI